MKTFVENISAHLVGLGLIFFQIDVMIIGGLTSSRLGFVFIIVAFMFVYSYSENTSKPKFGRPIIISSAIILFATLFSALYNMIGMERVVTYLFIFLVLLVLHKLLNNTTHSIKILKWTAIYSYITILILIAFSIREFGVNAFTSKGLRHAIDSLPQGLSRIGISLVIANIFMIMYYSLTKARWIRILIWTSFIMSYWFMLSTFTRQGFLLLSIVFVGFIYPLYTKMKYKGLGFMIIISFLTILFVKIAQSEVFKERFILRTQEEVGTGEGSSNFRIYLYQKGMELFEENIFLGVGPTNYVNIVQKDAHGIMAVISETGILAIVSILILLIASWKIIWHYRKTFPQNLTTYFLVTVIAANFSKTLYHLPMFWSSLMVIYYYNNLFVHRVHKRNFIN